MSSFPPSDPDRLPPPNYAPTSTDEWARELRQKGGGPPLRGLAIDPAYPPTQKDADRVLQRMRQEQREARFVGSEPERTLPSASQDGIQQDARSSDPPANVRRSSGASMIFSEAPSTSEVVNTMPGADMHSAMPKSGPLPPAQPTISDGLQTIKPGSFLTVHQQPCARESFLNGFLAGALLGGAVWISGRPLWRVYNWCFWPFMGTSVGSYAYCNMQRRREKEGMRAAVRIIEEKKEEKRERVLKAIEERRRREAEKGSLAEKVQASRGSWSRWWEGRPGEREG